MTELINKGRLLDSLERQSELITALRNEIATKDKRIAECDKRIAELESHLAAVLATVDAATAPDGRTYAEGCKP